MGGDAVFQGKHLHNLDEKGRTSIPASFRKVVQGLGGNQLILTRDHSPCLIAFTMDIWQRVTENLAKKSMLDPRVMAFERVFTGHAFEAAIDRQGRILIPPHLREHAGLEKEVVFTGRINKFELWQPARWDEAVTQSLEVLESGGQDLELFL